MMNVMYVQESMSSNLNAALPGDAIMASKTHGAG